MKKTERIIWASVVLILIVSSLFAIFIKDVWAESSDSTYLIFLNKLKYVFNIIEKEYVTENIDKDKLFNGAIKGMIDALNDPHSIYLSEANMKDLNANTEGKYGGLGMVISEKNDKIVVMTPMVGSPAYLKGIRSGDFLLSVNGETLKGVTVSEAAGKLRGEPGTTVKIEVMRNDVVFDVELKRALIDLPSVQYAVINNKYGYVRIIEFSMTTNKYLKEALKDFTVKKVKGIIVDLRDNPGGY